MSCGLSNAPSDNVPANSSAIYPPVDAIVTAKLSVSSSPNLRLVDVEGIKQEQVVFHSVLLSEVHRCPTMLVDKSKELQNVRTSVSGQLELYQ